MNSKKPRTLVSVKDGTRHSGTNAMLNPAFLSARVREKSSLADPCQASIACISSKRSRRMAVPPPQQKLWSCAPKYVPPMYVAIGAFQADASALQNGPALPPGLGI